MRCGMDGVVIRSNQNSYQGTCNFLMDELGFEILSLSEKQTKTIKSSKEEIVEGTKAIFRILRNLFSIRAYDTIISIGNYTTLFLLVLNKLHFVHPKKLYWWGFFFHSKKMQKIIKWILKPFMSENVRFLLFSECEKELYSSLIGINKRNMIYIPYGDWGGK